MSGEEAAVENGSCEEICSYCNRSHFRYVAENKKRPVKKEGQ